MGQNRAFIASQTTGRARFHIVPQAGLRLSLTFSICLLVLAWSHAEQEFTSIRSYDGNFLVTAPDPTTAGWVAKAAELTRESVFGLLGHSGEWDRAASLVLLRQKQDTAAGDVELWTISTAKDRFKAADAGVYPNKMGDTVVFQVVRLCLEDMAGGPLHEGKPPPTRAVPIWLCCGVAENLDLANLAPVREYAAESVTSDRFFPIEELFQAKAIPSDESQRELFFKESASVVDFLLHREDGRSKLRRAVLDLRTEGHFAASLLSAFAQDLVTLAHLQEQWKEFAVEQAERTIRAPKMLLWETKAALDRVLTVRIPTVDRNSLEEKVITTDLEGLFRHRNKPVVRQIAREKRDEVYRLRVRSKPEYSPILDEYLVALTGIWNNDRSAFKTHFARAEGLRNRLQASPDFKLEVSEDVNTVDQ